MESLSISKLNKVKFVIFFIIIIVIFSFINVVATNKADELRENARKTRDAAAFLAFKTNYDLLPYISQLVGSVGEMQKVILLNQMFMKFENIEEPDVDYLEFYLNIFEEMNESMIFIYPKCLHFR